MDRPPLPGGVVTIADGTIVSVTPRGETPADVDLGDVILLPGLINVHTHLDLSYAAACRSVLASPAVPLPDWLERVVAFRRSQTFAQRQEAIQAGLHACWQSGVTTVGDIVTDPQLWPVLVRSPLRGVAFLEVLGLTTPRAEAARRAAEEWLTPAISGASPPAASLVSASPVSADASSVSGSPVSGASPPAASSVCASPASADASSVSESAGPASCRWRRGVSPHAPYSVRRELFAVALELAAKQQSPLAIHLAESREEAELLHTHGGAFRDLLQRLGVWDPAGLIPSWEALLAWASAHRGPVLWIHANYLSPRSLPANHSVVYCPRTHAVFGHSPYLLPAWRQAGVRLCLATDSLASNPDLDLLAEARFVHRHFPDLPAEEVLAMITREAAAALGSQPQLGTLSPGKAADLIVLPWPRGIPAQTDPCLAILESTVPVTGVMIGGRWLFVPENCSPLLR
jgi:cytosine/adenosine deaminase-related metal-dependent hydrolase